MSKLFFKNVRAVEDLFTFGDKTTYNTQLNNIGKKLFGNNFLGVFNRETIKNVKFNEGDMAICNNGAPGLKLHQPEHWLGLYKYDGDIYMFDSFNRPVSYFGKPFDRFITLPHSVVEAVYAENCGQLAMAFLLCMQQFDPISFFNNI